VDYSFAMEQYCDIVYCRKLLKVELHAHANGSLNDAIVSRLLQKFAKSDTCKNYELSSMIIKKGEQRTMTEGFEMFKIIQQLVNSQEILFDCVKEVIGDFAADGVKYLELRSTPRDVPSTGLTKRVYIETVLKAMQAYNNDDSMLPIDVKYLPSIDRKFSVENAYEVIKLTQEFKLSTDNLIVGIDFSGNPYMNNGADYFEPLRYAKKVNLKLAVHLAEVNNQDDETRKLLLLPPDRIGHGTFLLNDSSLYEPVLEQKIPLEICMTSNAKTKTAPADYSKHHLFWWHQEKQHPCVLGTDDKGIFATSLSKEYQIAGDAMNLTRKQLFDWSKKTINYIFADQESKHKLIDIWDKFSRENKF